ncbi:hypothetical protein OPV22_016717 [Ensete ventricosum]|uniref:[RNA-polymerase]-subunit kinase n=1 Tax=Ensete ventricosum TaxID=4639 RepID=A0AAV8QQL5_ENSVE|nr:hypothetical protein OPV22_016717 [Ensete ventricosum]
MGCCICSKGSSPGGDGATHPRKSFKRFVTLLKLRDAAASKTHVASGGNPKSNSVSKPQDNVVSDLPPPTGEGKKKAPGCADRIRKSVAHQRRVTAVAGANRDNSQVVTAPNEAEANLGIVDVPNGLSGENVAAGWPPWLIAAAGEALSGWLPRTASSFEKLDKIGQGTYSNVYRARDLETGKIVALKKVRFVNMDPESVRFMAREINVLHRLDHPNVIKLEGVVTSRVSGNLYLVFEYMEHDLAGLAARPGTKFTEPQVKCYMQQLLEGLAHCHSRGILHRDIKGSNLLIDNNGILKIADFGLATIFNPDQTQPLTSRVVTLWYRPPELLLGATEYGVAVDLWSSGCILAELLAGKPIMPGRTELGFSSDMRVDQSVQVEQLHKIFKLLGSPSDEYWKKSKLPHATIFKPQHQYKRCFADTFKDFPSSALTLLDTLLAIEPENRGTAASALESEFFRTKPLACDPSSLPKYPPSKEYDAKLRDEEIRRQRAEATKGRSETAGPGRRETKGMAMPGANMELQKQQAQAYNAQDAESRSGVPIDSPVGTAQNGFYQLDVHPGGYGATLTKKVNQKEMRVPGPSDSWARVSNDSQFRKQRSYIHLSGADGVPGSVAARTTANIRYNRLDVTESSDKHILDRAASTHKKDDRTVSKESTIVYGTGNKKIQYSGPLMPPGGNVEDMLKEHERQIQQAVRKARIDKVKTKKNF